MSLEGSKGIEKKRSGIIEAAAFATAILGAIDSGPAQALEIAPGTSWNTAITQNIRNAVKNETNESATVFIQFNDNGSVWPTIERGSEETVAYDPAKEFNYVSERWKDKSIEVRCRLHTHPASTSAEGPLGKMYSSQYYPPSDGDVINQKINTDINRYYSMVHMPVKRMETIAADPSGIWYYGPADEKRVTEVSKKSWEKAYGDFVWKSILNKDFNFSVEYPKLQQAYRDNLGAEIRFVAYADIANEPPCAGVNYKAGIIKPNYDVKVNPSNQLQKKPETVVRPAGNPQMNTLTRPGFGEITEPQGRRSLGDDGPPIYSVGAPQR